MRRRERLSALRVYLSYPYGDDPPKRLAEVKALAERLHKENPERLLYIPHLFFYEFEAKFGRNYAMQCALDLLSQADVLCIGLPKNEPLSEGMAVEKGFAESARPQTEPPKWLG